MLKKEIEQEFEKVKADLALAQHIVAITRQRCEHLEIEIAQARISRDKYRSNYEAVEAWMKRHFGVTKAGELVQLARIVSPGPQPTKGSAICWVNPAPNAEPSFVPSPSVMVEIGA